MTDNGPTYPCRGGGSYAFPPDGRVAAYYNGEFKWYSSARATAPLTDDDVAAMKERCHTQLRALRYASGFDCVEEKDILNLPTTADLERALVVVADAYADLWAAIAEIERTRKANS